MKNTEAGEEKENGAARSPRPEKNEAVEKAKDIIAGLGSSPAEVLDLVKKLKTERAFGYARKALIAVLADPDRESEIRSNPKMQIRFAQARSLCTYKDPDLPTEKKLDDALRILKKEANLDNSADPETLGQAGAIFKRKWEARAQRSDLETALMYYLRGHQQGIAKDYGYTAINAAFIEDSLAVEDTPKALGAGEPVSPADARRARARVIREEIVKTLDTTPALYEAQGNEFLKDEWWFFATIAEAHFGLGNYASAKMWLARAETFTKAPDWEKESTARQLARLAWLNRPADVEVDALAETEAGRVLESIAELKDKPLAIAALLKGKTGLALSGGGFRASFYHIGVLARLAELDLLRGIEYLSCVSGGSIIGAYYYLEVRALLQRKNDESNNDEIESDEKISKQDFIDIVKRVEVNFLAGVQRNIRTRVAAEWLTNLKLAFWPDYSRTIRAGELYERELYSRVADGEGGEPRWLDELIIRPKGESAGFRPKDNNWRRSVKVPILVLNATSLNTGHNWQFTATWMGEPPAAGGDAAVDANYRLRRVYYADAPPGNRKIRLGYAVGASACVPGIFEPLPLRNLYPDKTAESNEATPDITVRLVDGGVHDNQGTSSLIEQGCTVLLVSDASGQMNSEDTPSTGLLGVPLRANSILQARVRQAQYRELDARRSTGLLQGLMFIHLKLGLESEPKDWMNCQDVSPPANQKPLLPYGIQREVQRRLAAIRTDLDSFSEVEAYSLMASGYAMTGHAIAAGELGFHPQATASEHWRFREIMAYMAESGGNPLLMSQLKVANKIALKVWMLSRKLQIAAVAFLLAIVALAVQRYQDWYPVPLLKLSLGGLATAIVVVVVTPSLLPWIGRKLRYHKTLQDILLGLAMAFPGFIFARLHLWIFDEGFLRQGTLARLKNSRQAGVLPDCPRRRSS